MPHKVQISFQEYMNICDGIKEINKQIFDLKILKTSLLDSYGISRQSFYNYSMRYSYYTEDTLTKSDYKYIKEMNKPEVLYKK